jgi:hypothetical protein
VTTTTTRTLTTLSLAALVAASLTSCSLLPNPLGGGGSDNAEAPNADSELIGTTWVGTDSDGDSWEFELQSDGTVGLTYNDSDYDDPADVWFQSGSQLRINVAFDDGDVDLNGVYTDLDSAIDLAGSYDGGSFSLTVTRD